MIDAPPSVGLYRVNPRKRERETMASFHHILWGMITFWEGEGRGRVTTADHRVFRETVR